MTALIALQFQCQVTSVLDIGLLSVCCEAVCRKQTAGFLTWHLLVNICPQERETHLQIVHANFSKAEKGYDIALLVLSKPVEGHNPIGANITRMDEVAGLCLYSLGWFRIGEMGIPPASRGLKCTRPVSNEECKQTAVGNIPKGTVCSEFGPNANCECECNSSPCAGHTVLQHSHTVTVSFHGCLTVMALYMWLLWPARESHDVVLLPWHHFHNVVCVKLTVNSSQQQQDVDWLKQ